MLSSEAIVNGEPVEFTYENSTLTWTKTKGKNDGVSSVEDKGTILESDVLAIVPISNAPPVYKVYTLQTVDSPENIALPVPDVELHQTELRGAPEAFISKHLVSGLATPHISLPAEDIYVVISSKSGTGKAAAFFKDVLQPVLKALGLGEDAYQVIRTTSHETITELAETKLRDKASTGVRQTLILLSGDGGVVELLNGLVGAEASRVYKRPAIAIFPFGTGNALFHSTNRQPANPSPTPLHRALTSLTSPNSHPLPHFRASFSSASLLTNEGRTATPLPNNELHGCIVASYGFHSTLVADSDTTELRKHGDKRFQIVAQELLGDPHRYKARVTLTGRSGEEKVVDRETHAYILCTLVSNLEKAFTISPHTTPLDEVMRVVHFDSGSGAEIMGVMTEAYSGGKHIDRGDSLVGYEEVEALRIDFGEGEVEGNEGKWLRVCVDGLIVMVESGGWMRVEKVKRGNEVLDIVV